MNKHYYLGLAIIGLILPYSQFLPFLIENGLNLPLIIQETTGYRLSAFAWLDVLITATTVITLVLEQKDRVKNWWIPVIATLLIGPSSGLPIFLYLRD